MPPGQYCQLILLVPSAVNVYEIWAGVSCLSSQLIHFRLPAHLPTGAALTGIRELARHLHLSIGTVSRALNGKTDVNPLTRQRVSEAATRLGYSPNQSGRSLRRGQTDLVGMIVPTGTAGSVINTEFLFVLDGLRSTLRERRLDLAIFMSGEDDGALEALRRIAERRLVDGIIIADTQRIDPRIDYLMDKRKPFVAFGRSLSGGNHAWVDPDFQRTVDGAIAVLTARGHRHIALSLAASTTNYWQVVEEAYHATMRAYGLPQSADLVIRRPTGESGGYQVAADLLAQAPRPTAVITAGGLHAVGIYKRLAESNLIPGRDISVVDVLPDVQSLQLRPTLAAFHTDWKVVGRNLANALLAAMGRSDDTLKPIPSRAAQSQDGRQVAQILVPTVYREGASADLLLD